jgi:hypothetical protein
MHSPPDPQMERAALAGSPTFQRQRPTEPHQFNEATVDYQAEKLRRLYSFCEATACTIAQLAFSVRR